MILCVCVCVPEVGSLNLKAYETSLHGFRSTLEKCQVSRRPFNVLLQDAKGTKELC